MDELDHVRGHTDRAAHVVPGEGEVPTSTTRHPLRGRNLCTGLETAVDMGVSNDITY